MQDQINLLDYWRILLKWKKFILMVVFLVSLLSIVISSILPKTYKAEATIVPIGGQKSGGLAFLAAQIGLDGLLGGMEGLSSSSSAQLMALLKSRTLAEKILKKLELKKIFYDSKKIPATEDALLRLSTIVKFIEDKKNQVITIHAITKDPKLSANIVNEYIRELQKHINENTFSVAKKNRIFIEEQLERNKTELLESGKELSAFYATNRISNVVPTVDVNVSSTKSKTVENSTPELDPHQPMTQKPEAGFPGVSTAFAEVQKKAEDLQKKVHVVDETIERVRMVKDVPQQVYLQYLTLRRQLLGQVNALLTSQYEMSKIEEAKEDLNFQVIDWAREPFRRFKPKRTQMVVTAFVLSFFLSIFYVFFREYLEKMKNA